MLKYLSQIWSSKDLRNKILFTLAILITYRFIAQITVPGANTEVLKQAMSGQSEILQVFSLLTGGNTESFSIVLMGISPYITASIIIQLLTVIVPKFENLSKEGDQGRKTLNMYTRWLTFPLALMQSYAMIILLNSQLQLAVPIVDTTNPGVVLPIMLTISAGTLLLVWMGDLISEKGIGNGISMIIFTSIISQVPPMLAQSLFLAQDDENKLLAFIVMVLVSLILLTVVILVTEGQRKIPLTYAGRSVKTASDQAFLPIKINQAGMIPIIFAVAIISFPSLIGQFMVNGNSPWVVSVGNTLVTLLSPQSVTYLVVYFLLVFGFTFFYVSITFNPVQVAENIQKRGAYVPGIRPGQQTTEYLGQVSNRLTLFGAIFIALIAVSPLILQFFFSSSSVGSVPLLITGASMIIIVGTILELIRQVNAQLVMHDYSKFY